MSLDAYVINVLFMQIIFLNVHNGSEESSVNYEQAIVKAPHMILRIYTRVRKIVLQTFILMSYKDIYYITPL